MLKPEEKGVIQILHGADVRNFSLRRAARQRFAEAAGRTQEIFGHPNPIEQLCTTLTEEQAAEPDRSLHGLIGSIDSLGKQLSAVIRAEGTLVEAGTRASPTNAALKVEKLFFGEHTKPLYLVAQEDVGYYVDPYVGEEAPNPRRVWFSGTGGELSIEVKGNKTVDNRQRLLSVSLRPDQLLWFAEVYRYLPDGLAFDHLGANGFVQVRKKLQTKHGSAFDKELKDIDLEDLKKYHAALVTGASALLSAVLR